MHSISARVAAWQLTLIVASSCHTPLRAADQSSVESSVQPKVVKLFGAGGISGLQSYGTGSLSHRTGTLRQSSATCWTGTRFRSSLPTENDTREKWLPRNRSSIWLCSRSRQTGSTTSICPRSQPPTGNTHLRIQQHVQGRHRRRATFGPAWSHIGPHQAGRPSRAVCVQLRRTVYIVDAITNNPGSAGGVLTSRDGKLLGMLGRELRDAQSQVWVNYVVPIGELAPTLQAMMRGDYTREAVAEATAVQREIPRGCSGSSSSRTSSSALRPTSTKCCRVPQLMRRNSARRPDCLSERESRGLRAGPASRAESAATGPGCRVRDPPRGELVTVTLPVPTELDAAPATP